MSNHQPLPPVTDAPRRLATPDFATAVGSERRYRQNEKMFGGVDMWLALKSLPAIAFMEVMQTEAQTTYDTSADGHRSALERVVEAPFDWKAVAVSAGAYAVGSAAARINNRNKLDAEVAEAVHQMHEGGQLTPYTETQLERRRFVTKARRGLLTAAGCVAAYKVGEHGTLAQDMVAGGGLVAGAMASVAAVNLRSKRRIAKLVRPQSRSTDVVPKGDYMDGSVAYDEDRGLPSAPTGRDVHGQLNS